MCDGGRVVGMCEQERISRTRRESLPAGKLPALTVATILRNEPYTNPDIASCAVAERAITLPPGLPLEYVDHREGSKQFT